MSTVSQAMRAREHDETSPMQRLTIFSVRPFHMSSPMALYCLLVEAMAEMRFAGRMQGADRGERQSRSHSRGERESGSAQSKLHSRLLRDMHAEISGQTGLLHD